MNDSFKILLDISKEDFNASKLLYDNDFYPQSLFYFQQSVEKLIKYLGIKDGIIKQEDLRKQISHNSSIVFKRAMAKYQYLDSSNNDFDVNSEFQDLKNIIDKIPENKLLDVILDKILETIKGEISLPFNIDKIQSFEEFYKYLKETDPDTPNLDDFINGKTFRQRAQIMFEDLKSELKDNIKGIAMLFYINIVTERLVSSVRYPDINNMTNPSEKYNSENPLIKALPNLFTAVEYSYEIIKSR